MVFVYLFVWGLCLFDFLFFLGKLIGRFGRKQNVRIKLLGYFFQKE